MNTKENENIENKLNDLVFIYRKHLPNINTVKAKQIEIILNKTYIELNTLLSKK